MTEKQFHIGDVVRFQYGTRPVQGVVKGIAGRSG
jgi:hypothetical protein